MARSVLNLLIFALSEIFEQSHGIWCHECVYVQGITDKVCVLSDPTGKTTGVDCSKYKEGTFERHGPMDVDNLKYDYCETAKGILDGKLSYHRACSVGPEDPNVTTEEVDDGFASDGSKITNLKVFYCNENNLCNNQTMSGGGLIVTPFFIPVLFPGVIIITFFTLFRLNIIL